MRVISGGNTGNAARLWHTPLRTRAAVRPALRQGAALAVGLAGGWAVLYGSLLPFGPGLALGLGEDCFAASAAGAALGLLLHGFGALSLQSICLLCGLGAIVAARWRAVRSASPLGQRAAAWNCCSSAGRMPCWPGPSALGCGASRPKSPARAPCCPPWPVPRLWAVWRSARWCWGWPPARRLNTSSAARERAGLRWPSVRPRGRRSALWTRNLPRRLPGSPAPRGRQPCWPRAGGWKRWPPTRAAA